MTFKPTIFTKASDDNESQNEPKSASRFDSLYQDAVKRNQSQSNPSPDNSFSFSPKLSARASAGSSRRDPSPLSVGERLYKLGTTNKPTSSQTPRLDPEATFTPQISKRANSVDRNRSISTSDRLHLQSKEQQARLEKLRESMNAQMNKECSFTPRLSHSGSVSDSASTASARDVTQRLLSYEAARQAKIEQARKQLEEQAAKDMTFRPSLPVSSRFATPTRLGQNVFEKLSKQTLQKDQNLAASLQSMNQSFSSKVSIYLLIIELSILLILIFRSIFPLMLFV